MPRVATVVPADTDILCEGCGYTLNGLPESSNCPECGKPIGQSVGEHRHPSPFERSGSLKSFVLTTSQVLFSAAQFYKTLWTRTSTPRARRFAICHRAIAAVLFVMAASVHLIWILETTATSLPVICTFAGILVAAASVVVAYLMLSGITALAAWLSAIEAKYWGMRLPQPIVQRGLQFHSACYFPVGLLAVGIVWGYRLLLVSGAVSFASATWYLYTLCAAVIISAVYLFGMYWIAMKNMMYANR